ncbi:MAG TPA: DNA replication/repair protein RecF [Clostridiales bacterium]|nr:DNA replication/repair protein RecF [Clostridiales bacterium]
MNVITVTLSHFRNFSEETIHLHPGINLFSGQNAQGKTNLLESLFYLSTLRPLRPVKEREMIQFGFPEAKVTAKICSFQREQCLSVGLSKEKRRVLCKNGVLQRKVQDFTGTLQSVFFSPDDLLLIKEGPAGRRRMIDLALSQLRPRYAGILTEYNRLLEQKGKILKQAEEKPSLLELLPVYNEKMVQAAGQIIAFRHAYCKLLSQYCERIHHNISGGKDTLKLAYTSLSNLPDTSLPPEQLTILAREHMNAHSKAELASKMCLSGPHKDDLQIFINETPAKSFGSQGQIRTAVLSLKLAERDILKKETGQSPVLLLDDVLSELDSKRQDFVLNRIAGGQVLISCCSIDRSARAYAGKQFSVVNGSIRECTDF